MCYKKWTFFEEWDRPHNIKTWSRPFLCRHQYFLAGNIAEMSPESARESHGNGVLNASNCPYLCGASTSEDRRLSLIY
jgi:hypothetical protein